MAPFKKKNRRKERQRHSGGWWPQYQAPAWWVCVTWVNTALVWDVVLDKGVAPQQKMLISQHDCDGSKSLGRWGNLLWQCSGLWRHVTALSHKSAPELLHLADGGKSTLCWLQSHLSASSYRCLARPRLGGSCFRRALCRIPRRPGMLSLGWWAPQPQPVPHRWGTLSKSPEK